MDRKTVFCSRLNFDILILCTLIVYVQSMTANVNIPCTKFQFEGYHCVPKDKCGHDNYEISEIGNVIPDEDIRKLGKELFKSSLNQDFDPTKYGCELDTDICCRKPEYYGKSEPVIRDLVETEHCCQDYKEYGYECVEECADDGYYDDDEDEISLIPRSVISIANRLSCQGTGESCSGAESSRVCCRKASFFGSPEPDGKLSINC